ncbi:cyclic nucleotide-binding domain-containing protein [Ferrovibrio sp.]|uniref:cyclic nucleotide-binding domain-containing protein n=1 Tax=Ferrovibrio sp. TaxID=1917215 RepID=UPI00262B3D5E|nr:cyclic nucleotide-binding domain-containing protein [Ferrovibrio sp.]
MIKPRQMIFHEGDEATHVFNITSGSVALSKSMADGRRQITGFLGAGDFLGFGAGTEYSLSAETLTDVHACRFTRRNFQQLLERVPVLEHRLLSLAETELETAQNQILLLGRKTAMERIASFLLLQMERAENRGMTTTPLLLPMTRAEVGDYLGLTIETVSRCFTKLRKANIISLLSADRVCINLPEKLAELASPSS